MIWIFPEQIGQLVPGSCLERQESWLDSGSTAVSLVVLLRCVVVSEKEVPKVSVEVAKSCSRAETMEEPKVDVRVVEVEKDKPRVERKVECC